MKMGLSQTMNKQNSVRTVDKQLVSLINCPKERFVNVPLLWNHGSEMVGKIRLNNIVKDTIIQQG